MHKNPSNQHWSCSVGLTDTHLGSTGACLKFPPPNHCTSNPPQHATPSKLHPILLIKTYQAYSCWRHIPMDEDKDKDEVRSPPYWCFSGGGLVLSHHAITILLLHICSVCAGQGTSLLDVLFHSWQLAWLLEPALLSKAARTAPDHCLQEAV